MSDDLFELISPLLMDDFDDRPEDHVPDMDEKIYLSEEGQRRVDLGKEQVKQLCQEMRQDMPLRKRIRILVNGKRRGLTDPELSFNLTDLLSFLQKDLGVDDARFARLLMIDQRTLTDIRQGYFYSTVSSATVLELLHIDMREFEIILKKVGFSYSSRYDKKEFQRGNQRSFASLHEIREELRRRDRIELL